MKNTKPNFQNYKSKKEFRQLFVRSSHRLKGFAFPASYL